MLRWCGNICSGYRQARDQHYDDEKKARRARRDGTASQVSVVQPARRLDEPEDDGLDAAAAYLSLSTEFGMTSAPPGHDLPGALVSPDFKRNPARLLVMMPGKGSEFGAWDPTAGPRGAPVPLLQWAQSNSYAAVLFSAKQLAERPAMMDEVLQGNFSKRVTVLVARGELPTLLALLAPLNAILYARMGTICIQADDGISADAAVDAITGAAGLPVDLGAHLRTSLVQLPTEWAELDAHLMRQSLFMLLADRENRWQEGEAAKFAGLSGLKENDLPGFKRMPISTRVQRLDRDRGNDELAHLIDSNMENFTGGQGDAAKALTSKAQSPLLGEEDEPGVD